MWSGDSGKGLSMSSRLSLYRCVSLILESHSPVTLTVFPPGAPALSTLIRGLPGNILRKLVAEESLMFEKEMLVGSRSLFEFVMWTGLMSHPLSLKNAFRKVSSVDVCSGSLLPSCMSDSS